MDRQHAYEWFRFDDNPLTEQIPWRSGTLRVTVAAKAHDSTAVPAFRPAAVRVTVEKDVNKRGGAAAKDMRIRTKHEELLALTAGKKKGPEESGRKRRAFSPTPFPAGHHVPIPPPKPQLNVTTQDDRKSPLLFPLAPQTPLPPPFHSSAISSSASISTSSSPSPSSSLSSRRVIASTIESSTKRKDFPEAEGPPMKRLRDSLSVEIDVTPSSVVPVAKDGKEATEPDDLSIWTVMGIDPEKDAQEVFNSKGLIEDQEHDEEEKDKEKEEE